MPWHHSSGFTHACTDVQKYQVTCTSADNVYESDMQLSSVGEHAMTSEGICVSVESEAKTFVRDRFLKVPDTITLTQLFEWVKPNRECIVLENVVVKCYSKLGSSWIDTELVNDFGCKYIRFMVPTQDSIHPLPYSGLVRTILPSHFNRSSHFHCISILFPP